MTGGERLGWLGVTGCERLGVSDCAPQTLMFVLRGVVMRGECCLPAWSECSHVC